MFDETGCHGLAVARGSLGNPWIFQEIDKFLKNNKVLPRPKIEEIVKVMIEHLDSSVDFYGERNGVVLFRKFFSWYTKGFRRVRHLREESSRAKTTQDMLDIVSSIKAVKNIDTLKWGGYNIASKRR
jgi:tRNA-dihydrouridine synthase B